MDNNRSDDALRWKWLSGNIVRKDEWVDLRENTYLLPNGMEITPYYTTRNRHFTVIVAENEDGDYICVRQYRPGTETVTTEFPAGAMEPGEEPLTAAQRELSEETGCTAARWTVLGRIAPNPTYADNYAWLYFAEGCRKTEERHLDASECMETVIIPAEEMQQMMLDGRIIQAVHVAAWFLMQAKRSGK